MRLTDLYLAIRSAPLQAGQLDQELATANNNPARLFHQAAAGSIVPPVAKNRRP